MLFKKMICLDKRIMWCYSCKQDMSAEADEKGDL